MVKRLVASMLWFGAVWFAWELAWSIAGIPRIAGPVAAASAAALVGIDPLGLFWPKMRREPLGTDLRVTIVSATATDASGVTH